jgi:hypothetical protein
MQIVRDDVLVARRRKMGQIASLVGLVIIGGGLVFTWVAPNWNVPAQYLLSVPLLTLLVGFILSNVGIYFTNRWGRSPRPDEMLDKSLKGMSRDYRLYHFGLPAPHVLLTPSGLQVLVVRYEGGRYAVKDEKWRQSFSVLRALNFMGREGLGNPTKDADYQVDRMRQFLVKHAPELEEVPVEPIIVFVADNVVLDVEDSRVPIQRAAKLKGFLRAETKKPLPSDTRRMLTELLDSAAGVSE